MEIYREIDVEEVKDENYDYHNNSDLGLCCNRGSCCLGFGKKD